MSDEPGEFPEDFPINFTAPKDIPLDVRMDMSGLLPGNEWEDDILSSMPEVILEWQAEFQTDDDPAAAAVIAAGHAQIARLVPETDSGERMLIALGAIAQQAWLYVTITQLCNELFGGAIPEVVEAILVSQEIRTTTLVSILLSMEDEVDMSAFEEML